MIIEKLDDKAIELSLESEPKIEGFPLAYEKKFNIVINLVDKYILLDSSFANRFIQLHLGNRFPKDQYPPYSWYLYPEETLYMVSVMEPIVQTSQKNYQSIRSQSIQKIYKTAQEKDINSIHFYLNMRKRNKFLRRINQFQLQNVEGVDKRDKDKKINELKLFKLYELSEHYKQDNSFKYVMVLGPEENIVESLFGEFCETLKKTLQEHNLHICIFANNDFVFLEIKK